MTDTVNVPRFQMEDWRNDLSHHGVGDIAAAVEMDNLLAAAPKAEPVSETVRLSLETADYLGRIAEEADENQWQDWATTMRGAAIYIRRLCAQPEAQKGEPVAWRYRNAEMPSFGWLKPEYNRRSVHGRIGFEEQPLYTHPAPASDELLEALESLLSNAEVARMHMAATEAGMLVGSSLFETILNARTAIDKHKGPRS